MHIHLLSVGTRMPAWVEAGFDTYAKRLPKGWLRLAEIPLPRRTGHTDIDKAKRIEGERLLAAAPKHALLVALHCEPRSWSTADLVSRLERWMRDGRDVALLLGGPDGLSEACLRAAQQTWSLSALTFPHGLVRVIVAEQLYRAWAIINAHPYHRS